MKIKITLIAFLASALIFTSCMKNESSPGIESVREAYAELLLAKAQAEITMANANAAFRNAEAAVQMAQALINESIADGNDAATERLRAQLAQDLLEWAIELDSLQQLLDKQLDDYAREVDSLNNVLALEYLGKYNTALANLRAAQVTYLAKNKAMLDIMRDIADGTTYELDRLTAELAAAQAYLANLQAELAGIDALLSNPDALKARLAELVNDSTYYMSLKLDLTAQKAECDEVAGAAPVAPSTAAYLAARAAAKDTAQAKLDFFATYPPPTFWTDAQAAIDDAQDSLDQLRLDSANAYAAWKVQQDIIDEQYDDLNQDIADANAEIDRLNDSIDLYGADTLLKLTAWDASVAQWESDTLDQFNREADLELLSDSLAVQRARYIAQGNTPPALWATILVNQGDSTQLEIDIAYHATNTIPDAVADTLTAYNAWLASKATYVAKVDTPATGFADLIADEQATIVNINTVLIPARTILIANAVATVDDLWSDYLHAITWIDEQVEVLARAIAEKDALQVEYETYMDEFFWDDYMVGLETAATNAYNAYLAAKAAYDTAKAAWDILNAPCLVLAAAITDAEDELQFIDAVTNAYRNAINYNDNAGDALEALIAAAELAIDNPAGGGLLQQIAAVEKAYADKELNLDDAQLELDGLLEQLDVLQAQVDYWKELLDSVLATI